MPALALRAENASRRAVDIPLSPARSLWFLRSNGPLHILTHRLPPDAMSSPASRRSNRNSVNGTPRRTSARNSEAPRSSPALPDADAANDQLRMEAEQASQDLPYENTPRAAVRSSQNTSQSQNPPTSSPLFFRSSPANGSQSQSQSANGAAGNGMNISSPLRQQTALSSDGGRTPRASGVGQLTGGMDDCMHILQTHH